MSNQLYQRLAQAAFYILFLAIAISTPTAKIRAESLINSQDSQRSFATKSSTPIVFEKNGGQFHSDVIYRTRTDKTIVWFTSDKILYHFFGLSTPETVEDHLSYFLDKKLPSSDDFDEHIVTVDFIGAKSSTHPEGETQLTGFNNYFIGNDPARWETAVKQYQSIKYTELYDGIDLRFKSSSNHLEYDFIINSGADPSLIRLKYSGAQKIIIKPNGNIEIVTAFGTITEKRPFAFQSENGSKKPIKVAFEKVGEFEISFKLLEKYDPKRELIIDPVLLYSSVFGGTDNDYARTIDVDSAGSAYVAGYLLSADFPIFNAIDSFYDGGGINGYDIFITKLNPAGDSIAYSTYLGGTDGDDLGLDIQLDSVNNIYLCGTTSSTDFPLASAYQGSNAGGIDAFLLKLSAAGDVLEYSTYLGGSADDQADAMVLSNGQVYMAGSSASSDFNLVNAYDNSLAGTRDAFWARFDNSGSLISSTLLGGSAREYANDITLSNGRPFITGQTNSNDFPFVAGYDVSYNGGVLYGDVFFSIFDSSGQNLDYSSFFGGLGDDMGEAIMVDASENIYLVGHTESPNLPTINAYDQTFNGERDIFAFKIAPPYVAPLTYCTYLGGAFIDHGTTAAIDAAGNLFLAGSTESPNFPTAIALDLSPNGVFDLFYSQLGPDGDTLIHSTFLGGIDYDFCFDMALDTARTAYLTGYTGSSNYPLSGSVLQTVPTGFTTFVTKIGRTLICIDSDGDGYGDPDEVDNECPDDNCPDIFNPTQDDNDSDLIGNPCDNCPDDTNPLQEDIDGDLIGDACDECTDTDGDGFGDPGFPANTCPEDNCPSLFNPDQEDADNDMIGDSCDVCTDTDGDGFGDPGFPANTCNEDNCPDINNPSQTNSDGDLFGDACDNCDLITNPGQEDADNDLIGDLCDDCTDTDGDGFGNPGFPANTCTEDNCPFVSNPTQTDTDSNGIGDVCDVGCCQSPIRGNVNNDIGDNINISDVAYLVSYLFGIPSGPAPTCAEEGNVNGDIGENINVSDISYLVAFLFGIPSGPSPPACP